MENELITPWSMENILDDFFVPEYIERIAQDVLTNYSLKVKSMVCVTTKPDKGGAIWKLETDQGPKSLKLLHRRPTRSLFSLGAQEYLTEVKKARVPKIIKTNQGVNYVEAGGKLWFVAEWIEPLAPVTKDLEGAKQLCYAIGEFHRLTQGYVPPKQAEVASRLYKWPKQYQKIINKMDWFRHIANAYHEMPASTAVLNVVDHFEEQAIRTYERLSNSSYPDLVRLGNEAWGLAHQDYGWSNGQMGPGGMWIIDLDGVAYDLAIRDLSKLITGTMSDLFRWDTEFVRGMIQAYDEANPIPPELYEILMIDLSLPTDFYKNIKEMVYEPELFLNEQTEAMIQTIITTDETKLPVLKEIENDWKGKTDRKLMISLPSNQNQDQDDAFNNILQWKLQSNGQSTEPTANWLENSQVLDDSKSIKKEKKKKKDKEKEDQLTKEEKKAKKRAKKLAKKEAERLAEERDSSTDEAKKAKKIAKKAAKKQKEEEEEREKAEKKAKKKKKNKKKAS